MTDRKLWDGVLQDEQRAFEEWLAGSCPDGDAESVRREWESSSEYADFLSAYTPPYRGYANLGTGMYCINHTDAPATAELIISIATDEDKAGNRQIGESRYKDAHVIQPIEMAVRIAFQSVQALDALEHQLRELRKEHFQDGCSERGRIIEWLRETATDEELSKIHSSSFVRVK